MCTNQSGVKRDIVMVQSNWSPSIPDGDGPLWHRLADALATDVQQGALRTGTRLPPHRELAHSLGVAVGTVSRAYSEAEHRGLVESHVGRGTFVIARSTVALTHRPADARINLGMNVPPVGPALAAANETLEALRKRGDIGSLFDYTFTAGLPTTREAAAAWLRERGGVTRAKADRVIQTNGGQHALMLACSSLVRAGETVLCDLATYPGNLTIAEHGGWRLQGVPADERGMDPTLLDRIAAGTGARLLLLIPTLHNPTTVTLDGARRAEIVEIARKRDLIIVEDDIYRVFGHDDEPPPLADLAPERVVHVTSISKALAPGLRVGFVLAPENEALFERLLLAAQATAFCPPAAGAMIFTEWMESGLAARILEEVRAEMVQRNLLARQILGQAVAEPASERSLHLWLPMEPEKASQVYAAALRSEVELTPPEAPFVDRSAVSGLRVCLGTPLELDELERGLRAVKDALDSDHLVNTRGVI